MGYYKMAMDNMFDDNEKNFKGSQNPSHREESEPRMQLDAEGQRKIINELQKHTNPLSTQSGDVLYNIVNGRVALAEASLRGGGVTALSALCTLCGPGVWGRRLGSLLCHSSGPILDRIWSAMRVASES